MKKALKNIIAILSLVLAVSCHSVSPSAGEEAILIHKPVFFGHGGVDPNPVSTGLKWVWFSTDAIYYDIKPVKYSEAIDDLISNENTPLDFKTNIVIRCVKGKTPVLYENYGEAWYDNNIKETYINLTRNYVSRYSPFDLTSNREVLAEIDSCVMSDMITHINNLSRVAEMPIVIESVITGRAIPNQAQLNEMNNTAAQIQARQSQQRRKEMEESREEAEKQRAIADKAYQTEMGLTAEQFISLKAWDIISEKEGANIDVLFNSETTSKMWNVKR